MITDDRVREDVGCGNPNCDAVHDVPPTQSGRIKRGQRWSEFGEWFSISTDSKSGPNSCPSGLGSQWSRSLGSI